MHRSGTSLLTRLLNLAGANIGSSLIEAAEDNPMGFWEDKEVVNVHESLFHALNMTWDSTALLENHGTSARPYQASLTALIEWLKQEYTDQLLPCIKDPRACRFMPLWHSIFEQLELRAVYPIVIRSPFEVAQSLKARDKMPYWKSHLLWALHVEESLRGTLGEPRVVMSYDSLLSEPCRQLDRISHLLQTPLTFKGEVVAEIESYVRPDMKHNTVDIGDLNGAALALENCYQRVALSSENENTLVETQEELADVVIPLLREIEENEKQLQAGLLVAYEHTDPTQVDLQDLADQRLYANFEESRLYSIMLKNSLTEAAAHYELLKQDYEEKVQQLADATNNSESIERALNKKETQLAQALVNGDSLRQALSEKEQQLKESMRNAEALNSALMLKCQDMDELESYTASLKKTLDKKENILAESTTYSKSLCDVLKEKEQYINALAQQRDELAAQLEAEKAKGIYQLLSERLKPHQAS